MLMAYSIQIPVIIIYLVGIGFSIAYWNRYSRVSKLAFSAFVLLLLALVASTFVSTYFIPLIAERGGSLRSVETFLASVGAVRSVLHLIAFVFLLVAIFSGRSQTAIRS